ncbi:Lysine-specific demethylase 8 [Rhizophlyctis rosea]|nr:Lysine-specific demethylase 8 [Rhizophlyctis rosea]
METVLQRLDVLIVQEPNEDCSPVQYLLHQFQHAISTNQHSVASELADALVDNAREALYSVPYKLVSERTRAGYELACLCNTLVLLRGWADGGKQLALTSERAEETLRCCREALKVLDMALLMSGCPKHKPLVLELIAALETTIDQAHQHLPIEQSPPTPPNTQPSSTPYPPIHHRIPRLETPPSLAEFTTHLHHTPTPLLISNALTHWPALTTHPWSNTTYLRRLAGADRTVPVEIGRKYTDDAWSQKLMTFGEFLDQFLSSTSPPEEIGYLAQHDLFAQMPQLRGDIVTPDYCYVATGDEESDSENEEDVVTNAWVGPAGTVTPLHTDPRHNLFAQVVGAKYVRLYSPEETPNLYPHEEGMLSNTSSVDVEDPDLEMFPRFQEAKYVECVVEAGDLLCIPVGVFVVNGL